jgi:hypothetical protein
VQSSSPTVHTYIMVIIMTEHLDKDISEGIFPKSLVISHTIWAQDS